MSEARSSSNRTGGVCDAVLRKGQRDAGPMRLPVNRADDFIDHFNRIYKGVGMTLAAVEEQRRISLRENTEVDD